MSFDLSLPVNTALTLYILYCVQKIVFPSTSIPAKPPTEFKEGYSWLPKAHPPTLLFQTFTPKTLAPFNGENGKRILLAIKGVVYDVTAGRNFYGPSERCLLCVPRSQGNPSIPQTACTPISQDVMLPEEWPNSRSKKVRL